MDDRSDTPDTAPHVTVHTHAHAPPAPEFRILCAELRLHRNDSPALNSGQRCAGIHSANPCPCTNLAHGFDAYFKVSGHEGGDVIAPSMRLTNWRTGFRGHGFVYAYAGANLI